MRRTRRRELVLRLIFPVCRISDQLFQGVSHFRLGVMEEEFQGFIPELVHFFGCIANTTCFSDCINNKFDFVLTGILVFDNIDQLSADSRAGVIQRVY